MRLDSAVLLLEGSDRVHCCGLALTPPLFILSCGGSDLEQLRVVCLVESGHALMAGIRGRLNSTFRLEKVNDFQKSPETTILFEYRPITVSTRTTLSTELIAACR
jgi:hypothetical protein